jgi:hypothetical protein
VAEVVAKRVVSHGGDIRVTPYADLGSSDP